MRSSDNLEPFTGHSAFGIVADTESFMRSSSLTTPSANSGKTIEELLKEAGIDNYTNDFFLGIAHWALRERAVLTFFREIGGQWSDLENKALFDAFGNPFYTHEDDMWEGDDRRYLLSDAFTKDRRLDQMRAWQCAAALTGYANDPPVPEDQPPSFPNIKKRDTQGIQYLFLNWACIECMEWNRTLGDVILHQDVSARVRKALRSKEWQAAVANQLARIDFHDYKDELLGLVLKLLVLNWPEIKAGTINPVDLVDDVLYVDKAIFGTKAAGAVPKLFDSNLADRWNNGIEVFAQRSREKVKSFIEVYRDADRKKFEKYVQKEWDYTGGYATSGTIHCKQPNHGKYPEPIDFKSVEAPVLED